MASRSSGKSISPITKRRLPWPTRPRPPADGVPHPADRGLQRTIRGYQRLGLEDEPRLRANTGTAGRARRRSTDLLCATGARLTQTVSAQAPAGGTPSRLRGRLRSEQSGEESAEQLQEIELFGARVTRRWISATPDKIFGRDRRASASGRGAALRGSALNKGIKAPLTPNRPKRPT